MCWQLWEYWMNKPLYVIMDTLPTQLWTHHAIMGCIWALCHFMIDMSWERSLWLINKSVQRCVNWLFPLEMVFGGIWFPAPQRRQSEWRACCFPLIEIQAVSKDLHSLQISWSRTYRKITLKIRIYLNAPACIYTGTRLRCGTRWLKIFFPCTDLSATRHICQSIFAPVFTNSAVVDKAFTYACIQRYPWNCMDVKSWINSRPDCC